MKTTKNSERIISEFFKPYFEKYTLMESIWFSIYDMGDEICLADDDCGINEFRGEELSDDKMDQSSYKIQCAIQQLIESKVDLTNIITDLEKVVDKLQKDSRNSNPLNNIFDDVWCEKNINKLTKKVEKHLKKEIPWKYIDWCICKVNRDGSVEIEEYQR